MYEKISKRNIGVGLALCLLFCLFLAACGKGTVNPITENNEPADTINKSEQDADLSFLSGKSLIFLERMQDEVLCYVTQMPDTDEKTAYLYASNTKEVLREIALSEKANYFCTDGVRLFAVDQFDGIDGRIYRYTVSGTEDTSYSYTDGIQIVPEMESEFRWQDMTTGKWYCRFENKMVTINESHQNFLFCSIGESPAQTYLVDLLTGEKRSIESLSGEQVPVSVLAFSDENVMIHRADDSVDEYTLKNLNGDVVRQWTYARSNDDGKMSSTNGSSIVIYDWQEPTGMSTLIDCADSTDKTITFQAVAESKWVKVSSDGSLILTFDRDSLFSLYETASGKCVKTFIVKDVQYGLQTDAVHFDIKERDIYIQTQQNNVLGIAIATY